MGRTVRIALTFAALPGGAVLSTATVAGARRMLGEASTPGGDPAAAVTGLACLLIALISGWLTVVLLLSVAAHLPGELGRAACRLRDRVTPAIVRRWAAVLLGASVTASVLPGTAVAAVRPDERPAPAPGWRASTTEPSSTPPSTATQLPEPGWLSRPLSPTSVPSAQAPSSTEASPSTASPSAASPSAASPTTAPRSAATSTAPDTAPAPGWTPRRPPARQRTDPHLLTGRTRAHPSDEVVVRGGDTLWSIAATHLGPGASDLEIAEAWPRWHAANVTSIGPNPHSLLPGSRLNPPPHHQQPGSVPSTKGTP